MLYFFGKDDPDQVSIFWRGQLRSDSVREIWNKAALHIMSVRDRTVGKPSLELLVSDIPDSMAKQIAQEPRTMLAAEIKVEVIGTASTVDFYMWGNTAGNYSPREPEVGFKIKTGDWTQPAVRDFILENLHASHANNDITRDELKGLGTILDRYISNSNLTSQPG